MASPNGSENVGLRMPQFDLEQLEVNRFVELITGQEIDNSEGIAELGATAFRNSPQVYMQAWRKVLAVVASEASTNHEWQGLQSTCGYRFKLGGKQRRFARKTTKSDPFLVGMGLSSFVLSGY